MLVELWRVISKPKIERPESFGSMEYFHRDQHCENPNPDLLTRHGMTRKVGASRGLQGPGPPSRGNSLPQRVSGGPSPRDKDRARASGR